MRVLLIEGQDGAAAAARAELVDAGHEVTSCHRDGHAAFPCRALIESETCPLDAAPVDVALLARTAGSPQQLPSEVGVSCALRRHIPLVSMGDQGESPYHPFVSEHVDGTDGLAAAVERAARAPLTRHTAAAQDALRRVLDEHDLREVEATGRVERRGDTLHLRLVTSEPIPVALRERASVLAHRAVRDFEHDAQIIHVAVEPEV